MTFLKSTKGSVVPIVAALAAATTLSLAQPAMAAPTSPAVSDMAAQVKTSFDLNQRALPIDRVQYWRRGWHGRPHWHHRHWRHRHWRGPGVAGVIAGAIIGGTIIASQRDYRDAWDRCAATYRSFSWSDGTFQPYDGPRQLCPYLAP
jgi:hypothetical protein